MARQHPARAHASSIEIGPGVFVGRHEPPLLIAEIGINHCGSATLAAAMMRDCAEAGIRAVKLQCHIPDAEMQRGHQWWSTVAQCALPEPDELMLFGLARELEVLCLSTPFSVPAVERLERIGATCYKLGSGETVDANARPIVDAVLATGKPVVASLGLLPDDYAGDRWWCRHADRVRTLACDSNYPSPPENWPLNEMDGSRDGYSSHSARTTDALCAVARGATIVEVHVRPRGLEREEVPDGMVSLTIGMAGWLQREMVDVWRACKPRPKAPSAVAHLCERDKDGRRMALTDDRFRAMTPAQRRAIVGGHGDE